MEENHKGNEQECPAAPPPDPLPTDSPILGDDGEI